MATTTTRPAMLARSPWDLTTALVTGTPVRVQTRCGEVHTGVVSQLQREDGSGLCWNVQFVAGGQATWVFVRFDA